MQPKIQFFKYNYYDEKGKPLFQVIKINDGNGKRFLQRRLEGKHYIYNLNGTRRVLYNLTAMMRAKAVCVVEGEKDVETLRKVGITATTCPCGSSSWRDEYNQYFKGKHVYIIPDNDEAGVKFSKTVAVGVYPHADSVSIIKLPYLDGGGDVTDWLKKNTRSSLLSFMSLDLNKVNASDIERYKEEINFTPQKRERVSNGRGKSSAKRDRALTYPIDRILDLNEKGMAYCLEHSENVPSLWTKNNWAYCFSCGYKGNVIDVAMKVWDCSFKEAMDKLNKLLDEEE